MTNPEIIDDTTWRASPAAHAALHLELASLAADEAEALRSVDDWPSDTYQRPQGGLRCEDVATEGLDSVSYWAVCVQTWQTARCQADVSDAEWAAQDDETRVLFERLPMYDDE